MTAEHTLLIEFKSRRPGYIAILEEIQAELHAVLRKAGFRDVNVEGRVKEPDSFVRKALREQFTDPLTEMDDIVGLRLVSTYQHGCQQLCNLMQDHFDVSTPDVKVMRLGDHILGYLGTHFCLNWPAVQGAQRASLSCEVQIRTSAEDTFARISHDLLYKGYEVLSEANERRSIFRLAALAEVIDDVAERGRVILKESPEYAEGRLIEALERQFFRLTGRRDGGDETSRDVINVLLQAYPGRDADRARGLISEFLARKEEKLAHVYELYARDESHLLLHRPEALMVFERIDADPFALRRAWSSTYFFQTDLDGMANIWGARLPEG